MRLMQYTKHSTWWGLVLALALIAAACGGGASDAPATTTTTAALVGAATTTTVPITTATTEAPAVATTQAPTTTTTAAPATTTTTVAPPTVAPGTVLVTNEDGVYVVTLSGVIATVIDTNPGVVGGIINYAIDDTQGGVIFDLSGSPWTTWGNDSIIYRVPAGADAASTLLIPSATQGLSLEDVEIRDGDITVYYTRLETAAGPPEFFQTLRTYNLTSLSVTELGLVGGWESGSSAISVGADRTMRNWDGEGWSGVMIEDHAGTTLALAGNPEPDGVFDCYPDCVTASITPDGTKVAWARQTSTGLEVTLTSLQSGAVLLNVTLPGIVAGYVDRLDVNDDYIIVNTIEEGSEFPTAARIIDIASGGVTNYVVPIPGRASLLRSPIQTSGVVSWP